MGIAAYNRGSVVISRQIDAERPSLNALLLADLSAFGTGTGRLFQATVIRPAPDGSWWLMDRPEEGWASYGRQFKGLREIANHYALDFTGTGRDEHSEFISVQPKAEARETRRT